MMCKFGDITLKATFKYIYFNTSILIDLFGSVNLIYKHNLDIYLSQETFKMGCLLRREVCYSSSNGFVSNRCLPFVASKLNLHVKKRDSHNAYVM